MSTRQKILVVDDEPRNQRIVCEILEDLFELQVASSGEEALTVLETFRPDLILLDIMMPGIDGYEVCRKVKQNSNFSHTKIILVSGKAMVEERLKGYELGADDYITKPFVPEELLAKAKVFLRLVYTETQLSDMNRHLDEKVKERTQQLLETEGKLISAAKMSALGEMAGGIAHEINTPLGTILLLIGQIRDMASEDQVDRESIHKMTKAIIDTVQRISRIIVGLKTFSRDGSKESLQITPLKQVIEDTVSLCREKLKHAGIELQVEPIADDLKVHCRAVQISQVLLNLINNACDAIAPLQEKWIKVSVRALPNKAEISVTDSGAGIPEEVRSRLFQPFFTTKEIGKGTGLGLSISKGIIDAHGDTLAIDPDCKNTRFVFALDLDTGAFTQAKQEVA